MKFRARNPNYIGTPPDVIAAVQGAMADKQYVDVDVLAETIPALKDKAEGEIDQVLLDSGMEMIRESEPGDDEPPPP